MRGPSTYCSHSLRSHSSQMNNHTGHKVHSHRSPADHRNHSPGCRSHLGSNSCCSPGSSSGFVLKMCQSTSRREINRYAFPSPFNTKLSNVQVLLSITNLGIFLSVFGWTQVQHIQWYSVKNTVASLTLTICTTMSKNILKSMITMKTLGVLFSNI